MGGWGLGRLDGDVSDDSSAMCAMKGGKEQSKKQSLATLRRGGRKGE